jgi:hypothetical protein
MKFMPKVLVNCEEAGLTVACVKEAMMPIGYGGHALSQLDRRESKAHHMKTRLARQPQFDKSWCLPTSDAFDWRPLNGRGNPLEP